jgi:hypothetical protein
MNKQPTFMIIGAMKSGTTSLYRYLSEHPNVYMSPIKEPHYFHFEARSLGLESGPDFHPPHNGYDVKNLYEYKKLFKDVKEQHKACGEASVSYITSKGVAQLINERFPEIKLIAVLREPISRLISAHTYCARWPELENLPLVDAIRDEPRRIAEREFQICRHVQLGHYSQQIEPYINIFGNRLKVILFEDLCKNSHAVMADVFQFLDLEPVNEINTRTVYNVGGVVTRPYIEQLVTSPTFKTFANMFLSSKTRSLIRKKMIKISRKPAELPEDLKQELRQRYEPDIRKLELLINRDLSHWTNQIS